MKIKKLWIYKQDGQEMNWVVGANAILEKDVITKVEKITRFNDNRYIIDFENKGQTVVTGFPNIIYAD